jgi:hypothetical protein
MISPIEIENHITEYSIKKEDDVIDILQARLQFAILDQIDHMINYAGFGNPKEVEKIILTQVKMSIESFGPEQVSLEDLK